MKMYGTSIKGKRDKNQDRYIMLQPNDKTTFLAVADGMGGSVGGEIASELVIDTAERVIEDSCNIHVEELELKTILKKIFEESQRKIKEKIFEDPKLEGMGTTLSCIIIHMDNYAWGSIGDSRIYLFNRESIQQITKDHSIIEEYNETDEIRLTGDMINYYGHFLTRSINGSKHKPDIFPATLPYEKLESNQGILLCSDGLLSKKRKIDSDVFLEKLQRSNNPKEFVDGLIDYAYNNGSKDNITCVTYWNINE